MGQMYPPDGDLESYYDDLQEAYNKSLSGKFDEWVAALRAICVERPRDILGCRIASEECRTVDGHIDRFLEEISEHGPLTDWYHDGVKPEDAFDHALWFLST